MRDSQRSKVYAWEDPWIQAHRSISKLEESECVEIIRFMHEQHGGTGTVDIKFSNCSGSSYTPWGNRFSIGSNGRNKAVLLHEVAHYLCAVEECRYNLDWAGHGPQFVGMLMLLNEKYLNLSLDDQIARAKRRNVQYILPLNGLPHGRWLKR